LLRGKQTYAPKNNSLKTLKKIRSRRSAWSILGVPQNFKTESRLDTVISQLNKLSTSVLHNIVQASNRIVETVQDTADKTVTAVKDSKTDLTGRIAHATNRIAETVKNTANNTVSAVHNSNTDLAELILDRQDQTIKAIRSKSTTEPRLADYIQSSVADYARSILERQEEIIEKVLKKTLGDEIVFANSNGTSSSNVESIQTPIAEQGLYSIVSQKAVLIICFILAAILIVLFTTALCVLFGNFIEFVFLKLKDYRRRCRERRTERNYAYENFRNTIPKKQPPPVPTRRTLNLNFPEIPSESELAALTAIQERDWKLEQVNDLSV